MLGLPDGSIDMIACDLPYGVTARNRWDVPIDLDPLWCAYRRVIKASGAIVLTATMKFAVDLISSNPTMFRYEIVWKKNKPTGFLNANRMPLRQHELILVFYKRLPTYNPQKTAGHPPVNRFTKHTSDGPCYGKTRRGIRGGGQTDRHPTSIWEIAVTNNDSKEHVHPTQKPVELFERIIRTYTNPGDVVLDNCIGSGTTAIAAVRSGRRWIGMESSKKWYRHATKRVRKCSDFGG